MKIFSIFSNPSGDLQGLQQELTSLFNLFNSADVKEKVDFQFSINDTVDQITSKLIGEQKDTSVFLFSGHSGKGGLNFSDEDFSSDHLVQFFNTLNSDKNSIQCVILNGCENEEIVKRLKNIPLVIGTKSKIQDSAAQKFTLDFFNALLKSESTYEQAFKEAISAGRNLNYSIYDNTRGEGYIDDLDQVNSLNQYFISKNSQKVADSRFPFKKKKTKEGTKWVRYIAGIMTLAAILLVGFFWNDIQTLIRGYSCPNFYKENKCNILITDFIGNTDMDVNAWSTLR